MPQQLWLDGICTEPGIVRQFVALPLGSGATIEEQVNTLKLQSTTCS